jgi:hypothetical protein
MLQMNFTFAKTYEVFANMESNLTLSLGLRAVGNFSKGKSIWKGMADLGRHGKGSSKFVVEFGLKACQNVGWFDFSLTGMFHRYALVKM